MQKREQDEQDQIFLQEMEPIIIFNRGCMKRINKSDSFDLGDGEKDQQIEIQTQREKKILSKIYYQEENIPKMPGMEQMQKCDSRQAIIVKTRYQIDTLSKRNELSKLLPIDQVKNRVELPFKNFNSDKAVPLNEIQHQINQLAYIQFLANEGNLTLPINNATSVHSISEIIPIEYSTKCEVLKQECVSNFKEGIEQKSEKIGSEIERINTGKLSYESSQHVTYLKNLSSKYRTMQCKNYHGSQGCGRGTYCHYIHLVEFEGKEIPKDISQKARLAYTNKRNKVIKEINDSESKNSLSDIRVGVLYQYTQNFMKLNEIMEYAEKQKQTQLAPQFEESSKHENPIQNVSAFNEKTLDRFTNSHQILCQTRLNKFTENKLNQQITSTLLPAGPYNFKQLNSGQLSMANSKASTYIRVIPSQSIGSIYGKFPPQSDTSAQNARSSYIMGTSHNALKK